MNLFSLLMALVALIFSLGIVVSRRWTLWKSILCVLLSALLPPAVIVTAQVGRVRSPSWISWGVRLALFIGLGAAALSLGDYFAEKNAAYQQFCVAAIYTLSETATVPLGTSMTNEDGVAFEFPKGFTLPFVIAAFGIGLGLLFFAQPFQHALVLGILGGVLGFVVKALDYAWLVDHAEEGYRTMQTETLQIPMLILLLIAMLLALLTARKTVTEEEPHANESESAAASA
ncbi:hypothetical protein [Botrimarina hoheduenensis]|uniref:Uncharacterized protein n=1 Tax=Botrimarina hoheduenensis TaxID=2528000 RepID=A0A5C5W731_9BACT|nr:hypothetical protein [Botrimarina hoheduenensis]TWT46668.1 hypothetical protein Pla111_17690 [Botrimarina hoheduenensis]